jgi:hypothetical protein
VSNVSMSTSLRGKSVTVAELYGRQTSLRNPTQARTVHSPPKAVDLCFNPCLQSCIREQLP